MDELTIHITDMIADALREKAEWNNKLQGHLTINIEQPRGGGNRIDFVVNALQEEGVRFIVLVEKV